MMMIYRDEFVFKKTSLCINVRRQISIQSFSHFQLPIIMARKPQQRILVVILNKYQAVGWLILIAFQPVWGYFMPRG